MVYCRLFCLNLINLTTSIFTLHIKCITCVFVYFAKQFCGYLIAFLLWNFQIEIFPVIDRHDRHVEKHLWQINWKLKGSQVNSCITVDLAINVSLILINASGRTLLNFPEGWDTVFMQTHENICELKYSLFFHESPNKMFEPWELWNKEERTKFYNV